MPSTVNGSFPPESCTRVVRYAKAVREAIPVVLLLMIHFALGWSAWSRKSITCDEVAHLTAGYTYWQTGDYRLVPEHPPLAQLWAALPLNFMTIDLPPASELSWQTSDVWTYGTTLLFQSDNDGHRMLMAGRAMIGLLSVILGLAVYAIARQCFGISGGLIALALYAFSPSTLSHGFLVTTDLAAALCFLLSVVGIRRVLDRVTPGTLLSSSAALAGLFASKMSAVLILPLYFFLLAMRIIGARPLVCRVFVERELHHRLKRLSVHVATMLVQAGIVIACLWAVHGLRFTALRDALTGIDRLPVVAGVDPSPDTSWVYTLNRLSALPARGIDYAREHRLLPEAYLYGLAYTLDMTVLRDAFLNGRRSVTGFAMFFPYCLFAKSTPAEWTLWLIGGCALIGIARKARCGRDKSHSSVPAIPLLATFGVFVVFYFAVAVGSGFNIGSRHLLPIYPPLFILAGAAGSWLRARRPAALVIVMLAVSQIGVAVRTWPNYLAYFNIAAGGSRNGYRHLVDSSLDWGQDLTELAAWLMHDASSADSSGRRDDNERAEHLSPVYLSYLGSAAPEAYNLRGRLLFAGLAGVSEDAFPLESGLYCISATRLQQVGLTPYAGWTEQMEHVYRTLSPFLRMGSRPGEQTGSVNPSAESAARRMVFARLCARLRLREPDGRAGCSILIYRVSDEELNHARSAPIPVLQPDTAYGLSLLGDLCVEAGAISAARTCYQRSLEMGPGLARTSYNLALVCYLEGDSAGAMEHLRRAVAIDPSDANVRLRLAMLLAQTGRRAEAVEQLQRVVRLRPYHADAHQLLADCLSAMGKEAAAQKHREQVRSLRPDQPQSDASSSSSIGQGPLFKKALSAATQRRSS